MHDVVDFTRLLKKRLSGFFYGRGAKVADVARDVAVGVGGFQSVDGAGEFLVGRGGDGDGRSVGEAQGGDGEADAGSAADDEDGFVGEFGGVGG